MLMPSIFGENLFDDFFGDFPFYYDDRAMKDAEKKLYGRRASHIMKTDIKETDKGYELVVDLPGFTKDEVKADLENGYLTISAEKGLDKDEQEKETGRYIRKERYAGACSRSFYVGKEVEKEDIKAEFNHSIVIYRNTIFPALFLCQHFFLTMSINLLCTLGLRTLTKSFQIF